ncbi:MAG: hypothetical protein ACI8P9_003341 [Parasphingorhabdus sp.]
MHKLIAVMILFALTGVPGHADEQSVQVPVCYDFGCKSEPTIDILADDWREVSGWFSPAAKTPELERVQIKKAIGWMEVVVGRYTPTHRDTGLDLEQGGEFPGQLDCIDESLNTTTYLKLFESNGYLRHHRVVERAYRRAIFDQHWAGQVEEIISKRRFVIDSWFQKNGILPYVQEYSQWKDIPFFFSSNIDNSTEYDAFQEQKPSFWKSLKSRVSGQQKQVSTN